MVGAIICSQGWKYTGVTGLGVEDAHLFDLARLSRKILEVVYRRSFPGDPIRRVTNWNDIYADKQQVLDVLMKAEKQERSGNVVEE
jgi:hypothetical protein